MGNTNSSTAHKPSLNDLNNANKLSSLHDFQQRMNSLRNSPDLEPITKSTTQNANNKYIAITNTAIPPPTHPPHQPGGVIYNPGHFPPPDTHVSHKPTMPHHNMGGQLQQYYPPQTNLIPSQQQYYQQPPPNNPFIYSRFGNYFNDKKRMYIFYGCFGALFMGLLYHERVYKHKKRRQQIQNQMMPYDTPGTSRSYMRG